MYVVHRLRLANLCIAASICGLLLHMSLTFRRQILALSASLAALLVAIAVMAPAQATHYRHHAVSKAQYANVFRYDERGHVEVSWGLEGHRTNHWKAGRETFLTKTYPTHTAGVTARAVYVYYHSPYFSPGQRAWGLWKTRWCVAAPTQADPAAVTCTTTIPRT